MKIGPRATLALVTSIVSLVLAMRLPGVGHEAGVDSFVMHGLANSLMRESRALWIVSPLSYFGLFPLSYPSASIFTVADISMLGALPIEGSLLISSFLMCIVGTLGAFLLGHQLTRDARFALVMALLLGAAPRFVLTSTWETPFRSGFMALIPLLMWALVRLHARMSFANLVLFGLLIILLPTFHRLAVLVVAILGAYLVTHAFVVGYRVLRQRFPALLLSPAAMRRGRLVLLTAIFLVAVGILFGSGILNSYSSGRLFEGTDSITASVNLGISLVRSVGVILPLAPFGVVYFAQKRAKSVVEFFVVAMALAIIPTLSLRTYTGFFAGAVLAPLAAGGFLFLVSKANRPAIRACLVASVLLAALGASVAIVSADIPFEGYMSDQEYSTGLYVKYSSHYTMIFNDGLFGSRVAAISGHSYLPVGGASTVFSGPELLIYGYVDLERIQIEPVPFWELDVNSDSPFVVSNVNAVQDWVDMLSYPLASSHSIQLRETYRVDGFVEQKTLDGQFDSFGRVYGSPALASLPGSFYKTYEDQNSRIWFVGLPGA